MSHYFTTQTRTERAGYFDGPARWINSALLVIVGFIGLDSLLRLLGANEQNGIVSFVRSISSLFLAPFHNMFPEQQYLLTALIAILGWALLAALILLIVRAAGGDQGRTVTRERREHVDAAEDPERDRTRPL